MRGVVVAAVVLLVAGCSAEPLPALSPTPTPAATSATPTATPTPSIDEQGEDYLSGWADGSAQLSRDATMAGNANYQAGYAAGKASRPPESDEPRKVHADQKRFLRYLADLGIKVEGREWDLINAADSVVCLADPADYWDLRAMNADLMKQLREDGFSTKEAHAILGGARTELDGCGS